MLRVTQRCARPAALGQWQSAAAGDAPRPLLPLRRPRVQPQAQYSCNSPQPYGGCGYRAPPPPCSCPPPPIPGCSNRIVTPGDCRQGDIQLNPCCPVAPEDEYSYLKYKYIFLFVMAPIIFFQYLRAMSHPTPCKPICREYEYMRRRTKSYPWGDGVKTFFHNEHTNALPPCPALPPECED